MKIKEVTEKLEIIAPRNTAMDFDNVGLLVGSDEEDCRGVLLTVDVTKEAVAIAEKENCNLIISHHPIIFDAMKSFLKDDYIADTVSRAYLAGISLYAAHTNVDRMTGNMSYRLLAALGAQDVRPFYDGFGAIGELEETTVAALAEKIKYFLDDENVFVVGDENAKISRIAEINGAGADREALAEARRRKVDLLISADLRHHIMLEAKETGLHLMSIGHYASEKSFNDVVYDIINCHYDTLKIVKYYEGNPYNGFPRGEK